MKARAARRRTALVSLVRAFRDAAAALPDALVAIDDERRIRWFNTAAGRLLGLTWPDHLGHRVDEVVAIPGIREWIASGGAESLPDVTAPGDAEVHLGMRLIPYADDHALLLGRDISQVLRLEKVRRDFVANVSHELRTPLTVVHGYLDLIEPEQIPEYESILRELRNQSRRMTQIVEDLLTLSRLDAEDALPETRVAMGPLLRTLMRDAEGLSRGRHEITIEATSEHDLLGSPKDLYSAFSNLVSNAVRYTPVGGRIAIAWQTDTNGGRLAVRDTGHGISPQHLPRLTERFYRVSTSRSRETGGTGLGLSIVKHVLQLHGAHLEVHSEVGAGSTFACIFGAERLLPPEPLCEEA
ncbi:phosphate regulon sensor histidine kinase PhoR [Dokdonella sp.]|uniref:phosphate regulon sensor histidine kinase PhoR n=1 Tax=Dokdonella sp. TaxID=2291710 RepID=UPI0025BCDA4E|nr:phosphate regulon sensor histidine kinase PhoR [Dokdonella sp.]MBX3692476.1 phosphate regulon sensor histidine kinase PhoR [Dokdonella sp.]MCW5567577.1 phosphate regulon sensor histidine kinase PhoR [Dokdonella sp.]